MKQLLLLPLLCAGTLHTDENTFHRVGIPQTERYTGPVHKTSLLQFGQQEQGGSVRMQAAVFKAQEFCRAELKNFEFDVQYSVVSAVVYFSGANFNGVEKGAINSNSLKMIREKMNRCIPGSVVIFDEVKVKGPDDLIRTIPGLSLVLY